MRQRSAKWWHSHLLFSHYTSQHFHFNTYYTLSRNWDSGWISSLVSEGNDADWGQVLPSNSGKKICSTFNVVFSFIIVTCSFSATLEEQSKFIIKGGESSTQRRSIRNVLLTHTECPFGGGSVSDLVAGQQTFLPLLISVLPLTSLSIFSTWEAAWRRLIHTYCSADTLWGHTAV